MWTQWIMSVELYLYILDHLSTYIGTQHISTSLFWDHSLCKPARQTTESKTCDQFVLQQNVSKLSGAQELRKIQVCLTCSCQPSDLWKLQQLHGFHVILLSMNSATDRSLRTTEDMQKSCKYAVFLCSCSELPPRAIFGNYSIFTYFYIVFLRFPVQHWFSQRFLRTAALQNYNVSMCSCSALFLRTVFGKYNDITIFLEPPWYFLYVERSPGCCTEWFLATTLHTNWLPRT